MLIDRPDLTEQPSKTTSLRAPAEPGLIVLDTDIGYDPDDFVSLVIAARTIPKLAVVTADENRGRRAQLTRHTLDLLDRDDVPVIPGIDIGGEHRFLTGNDRGLTVPSGDFADAVEDVGEAIARLCVTASGPIIWVGQGPMTNLVAALSFMPDLAERLVVTQMGGWLDRYRDTSRASHNFRIDPAAAGLVLRVLRTPRLVLSDVTNSPNIRVTPDWALFDRLQSPTAPAWAHLLAAHFQAWFARRDGSWMHDPLTLSAALGLPFVTFTPERIRIERDARIYRDPEGRVMEVACAVDYDGFLEWMHEGVSA